MNDCIAHRGPDDAGIFAEANVVLGHRRLSIIDLSAAGHQPMYSHNNQFVLVYNGEIYNFEEVKSQLRINTKTKSDSEVLLEAWVQKGPACLDLLNGMFAFAVYDKASEELHVVRDRLGIKPVYYKETSTEIAFASEIRAVLAADETENRLNPDALVDYLRYQTVHAPHTIVEGVRMLMPGHRMVINSKGVNFIEWWKPAVRPSALSYEEAKKQTRELLKASVKRRLVADVPFGAFLSGGIDSSAVVAMMSEVSSQPVKTFCVTFDESEYSEAKYAKLIAEKYKTEHTEIHLKPADFLQELPQALDAMDHPSGDGINTYVVSKATRNAGITMALSGLGGDELFAGYDVFRRVTEVQSKSWLNTIPRPIRKVGSSLLKATGKTAAKEKAAHVLSLPRIDFRSFYPVTRQVLLDEQIAVLLTSSANTRNSVAMIVDSLCVDCDNQHLLSCVSKAEIATYMQNVLLRDADQMSMASALEVRVPFLDYTLVEFALSLSDDIKFPHTAKKLLVDALRDELPPEITDRKKMGFVFPWEQWMRNELKDFCANRILWLQNNVAQLDSAGIHNLWNSFLSGDKRVTWSRIWPLVVLSHWMQKNNVRG